MNATEIWGILAGGAGLLVGAAGWIRNARGDTAGQAAWMGTVNAKLDHIAGELMKLNDIRERVAVLERDVRTAFERIDEMKGME